MNREYEYLKDEYLELGKHCPKVRGSKQIYTAEMVYKLREMAICDVIPDNRFSDEECSIWSSFHVLYSIKRES